MLKYILLLIGIFLSAFIEFQNDEIVNINYAVFSQIMLMYSCLLYMIEKDKIVLLPYNLLVFISFVYITFGEIIYIIRDSIFWNTQGSPIVPTKELNVYFLFFVLNSIALNVKYKDSQVVNTLNNISLKDSGVPLLYCFAFLGLYLFTNGFTYMPLFAADIVEARHNKVHTAGEGFGFVFMLCAVWLILFYLKDIIRSKDFYKIFLVAILAILLLIPGGRSLLVLPIYLFVAFYYRNKHVSSQLVLSIIPILLVFMFLMEFIAIYRAFGSINLADETQYAYLLSDFTPEFRSIVNFYCLAPDGLGDKFAGNVIFGNIPGFIYSLLGLDKDSLFVPTGKIVTQFSDYADHFEGGIRLSLLGEIFVCSPVVKIFVLITYIFCLDFCSKSLFYEKNEKDFIKQVFAYMIVFAIPYGFSFIMNALQVFIFLYLLNKVFFKYDDLHKILYKTN